MNTQVTEAIALIALAALCVVGIIVIAAITAVHGNDPAVSVLRDIAFVCVGGGAGVARQTIGK